MIKITSAMIEAGKAACMEVYAKCGREAKKVDLADVYTAVYAAMDAAKVKETAVERDL